MREEIEKWQLTSDKAAGEHIMEMCAGNIDYLVNKYGYSEEIKEELRGEAYIGVLEAMNKYSADHDASFFTYAEYWIKARIIRYISNNVHEDSTFFHNINVADEVYKNPEEQLLRTVMRDSFLEYFAALPFLSQQIFILKVNEHLTYKYIGAKLGIHRKHVSEIFRGMKKDIRCIN